MDSTQNRGVHHDDPEVLDRQRAHCARLREAAIAAGLLSAQDPYGEDGLLSEEASEAIERLLDLTLELTDPDEENARRYHAANPGVFSRGERVLARHVLFGVTPGVDFEALRGKAESCLLELRALPRDDRSGFAQAAGRLSNCPSGQTGGDLGWIGREDCCPELARELFGRSEVGVLPRLVATRFGLHVVEVIARQPGTVPVFEECRAAVLQILRQLAYATALRQYLQALECPTNS